MTHDMWHVTHNTSQLGEGETALDTVSHSVTLCDTIWQSAVWHNVKLPWQRPKAFFISSLSGDRDWCKVKRSWTIGGLPPTASMDRDQIQALKNSLNYQYLESRQSKARERWHDTGDTWNIIYILFFLLVLFSHVERFSVPVWVI